MSTKLNAEELAAKMYSLHDMLTDKEKENIQLDRNVCIETIRKVAQPIADERDELREALKKCLDFIETDGWSAKWIKEYRSILAKYHKP